MRLNNRGWGLKEMLILSSILIFFFCLAIYFIYVLYDSLADGFVVNEDYINESVYIEMERNIEEKSINYLSDNYVDNDTLVDIDLLIKEDYLEKVIDPETDNECTGYIKINNYDELDLKAYIKCDNYITKNYQE